MTKNIDFPARIRVADDAVTVNSRLAINLKDFNINFPGKPSDLIRNKVARKLDIEATPGEPQPEEQLSK